MLSKMKGKKYHLVLQKIQMGDKAEIKTGGSLPSKQNSSSAINHAHAEVRATQEFPEVEKKVMEGYANAFCSCVNITEEHIKNHFLALYKTPSAPS